ncbi:MBL fold metallo-hydrolase [Marinicellulosiphila megalodicopiae]|uniref:MBL fold metallo-hydrolase n=1 Tax=Marinicellulosiphila megalodicopiae TaxID=2724896 RepID=UPI003BB14B86
MNPRFKKIENPFQTFQVDDLIITAVSLNHSKLTYGYCIEHAGKRLAYLCDTKGIPKKTLDFLIQYKADTVIIDCTYPPNFKGYNHNDLNEAIEITKQLNCLNIYLTHISHELDCYLMDNPLPRGVNLAMDLLEFSIDYFEAGFSNCKKY